MPARAPNRAISHGAAMRPSTDPAAPPRMTSPTPCVLRPVSSRTTGMRATQLAMLRPERKKIAKTALRHARSSRSGRAAPESPPPGTVAEHRRAESVSWWARLRVHARRSPGSGSPRPPLFMSSSIDCFRRFKFVPSTDSGRRFAQVFGAGPCTRASGKRSGAGCPAPLQHERKKWLADAAGQRDRGVTRIDRRFFRGIHRCVDRSSTAPAVYDVHREGRTERRACCDVPMFHVIPTGTPRQSPLHRSPPRCSQIDRRTGLARDRSGDDDVMGRPVACVRVRNCVLKRVKRVTNRGCRAVGVRDTDVLNTEAQGRFRHPNHGGFCCAVPPDVHWVTRVTVGHDVGCE